MYALVLIEYSIKNLDKTFIYKIPSKYNNILKKGMKVKVNFGKQCLNGFVLDITNVCDQTYEVKEILEIVDPELILNDEMLDLASFLQESTLCTKILAFQTMLPRALKVKSHNQKYASYDTFLVSKKNDLELTELLNSKKIGINQKKIIEDIIKTKKVLKKNYSLSSVKSLLLKGIIEENKVQKYRIMVDNSNYIEKKLTDEQLNVFNSVDIETYNTYLLYGITGSGKTEVYIKLIEKVINQGKTAIMLVPEISLTAQITKRFYQKFGSDVAILHSALSNGEKYDEYLKILRGEVKIVVGTRSAIFAPLNNLGIIIIDEEHSNTYKQDNNPRYHAKDMATFRAKYNNIPLILGSATPTFESKARADKNVFKLLTLKNRIGASVLPTVHIVDMESEMKKRNMIFSNLLINKIEEKLQKKEQIILLLNRRGHSTFINCSNCGYVYKCPNCDITLTYHKTSNNLLCHYCGYLRKKDNLCPSCGEDGLNYMGLGTEKLEELLKTKFPLARIVRMDQDTTSKKGSHEQIITDFLNEKYDILLGTQMISKGLDFPKVSLVGVINADLSLNIPSFRSSENTFSLLNQVAGRSGRSNILGEVIIQTFNPDNYVMKCVKNNDYDSFYKQEMQIRHTLKYPPYYYLIGLKVIGKNYENTLNEAKKVKQYLEKNVSNETIILGPTTAAILKFNNEYRFQLIIKYRFDDLLHSVLKELDTLFINKKDIRIEIDFNPSHI